MPHQAVVGGDDRPVVLGAEQLLLQEDALRSAVVTDARDVAEERLALHVGDLLEPAPRHGPPRQPGHYLIFARTAYAIGCTWLVAGSGAACGWRRNPGQSRGLNG
jgi:hypothetical protein